MFEVVKSLDNSEKDHSFVALGYLIDNPIHHAAIIIKFNNNLFQFHFTGSAIDLSPLSYDFYHKITNIIQAGEVPAFISHCRAIAKQAPPSYGFFYSGDYFDEEGVYFGNKDVGQRMTCVGFCISTLKGFLEEDYILESDWEFDPDFRPGYLELYCIRHTLNIDLVKPFWKRITPGQFLASGYFSKTPIPKALIDNKYSDLKEEMVRRAGYFE
ncbi:hypothetical protein U3A58_10205 [Algoriphagus sp. C2-6-M1]|uniref:hypothetical protein n=1 Tax=Algoriphagus persicinus TaxID=3108754 RepID=UPI002B3D3A36|nr:hypothetical protein [Algoriphagus sp. C2-6-M1]MEB2780765.1 hypothetical protein [Algoriphagus sp. C2-6-M1]